MNITLQKGLSPDDWASLAGWSEAPFPPEGRGMEWAKLRWHVVAREEGKAIGHIGFDRFTVKADTRDVSVVGVGGVIVRPEFQKKGIPGLMFEKLHAECPPDIRSDTFTLFCPERLVPYYRKHGYAPLERAIKIRQGGKTVDSAFVLMARGPGLALTGREIILTSAPW